MMKSKGRDTGICIFVRLQEYLEGGFSVIYHISNCVSARKDLQTSGVQGPYSRA
jgi:hypothetical protein